MMQKTWCKTIILQFFRLTQGSRVTHGRGILCKTVGRGIKGGSKRYILSGSRLEKIVVIGEASSQFKNFGKESLRMKFHPYRWKAKMMRMSRQVIALNVRTRETKEFIFHGRIQCPILICSDRLPSFDKIKNQRFI